MTGLPKTNLSDDHRRLVHWYAVRSFLASRFRPASAPPHPLYKLRLLGYPAPRGHHRDD